MTPQEAAADMRRINLALAEGIDNAEKAALFTGLGDYTGRIFNDGKATDGSSMGGYSPEYKKKRETPRGSIKQKQIKKGKRAGQLTSSAKTLLTYPTSKLQTGYKDLQFFGDLLNNIQVGISGGNNVIGFLRTIDKLKMKGTEDYIKKDVIPLSEEEKETIDLVYKSRIDKIIKGE